MKKIIFTSLAGILLLGLLSFQLKTNIQHDSQEVIISNEIDISASSDVQAVLDRSCLPCHGVDGSGKAKFKWNYAKMRNLKPSKVISKMDKVIKEIKKDKMPPEKYIKKHPEVKLSNDDEELLIDWAKDLIKKMEEKS